MEPTDMESALPFVAYVHERADGSWNIRFPDVENVATTAQNEQSVPERARVALEKHLRQQMCDGTFPSWPGMHLAPHAHEKRCHINVPAGLSVAVQVRRLRIQRGWSQTELAHRVGVSQQQIAKVEDPDTNPTVDTIAKIARVFERPLVVVFGGADDMGRNMRRD